MTQQQGGKAMRLSLDDSGQRFIIRGFTAQSVRLNDRELTEPFLLTPERLIERVPVANLSELDASHSALLQSDQPEVVLIGTGSQTRWGAASVQAALLQQGIGVEFMDTGAACRTYTVLASELRRVALLIFF
ncbi:Mth938-like domain-containing protein [Halothiobacillus sp. DCM-1]|uniref:Mth938-like domain-containing protein n=1 Tax=Halothiobacillus sp. DCM-1 TaxID=3112558 RepID=UPI00324F28A1